MPRTLRNLIVNIIAAFIRDRNERHKFRNKYKIRSKFRKLRDDNRILFNDNKILKQEIQTIKRELDSLRAKNHFKYSPGTVAMCKRFYSQINNEDLSIRYCKLVKSLDAKSIDCVSRFLSRTKLISEQDSNKGGSLDIFTDNEKIQLEKFVKEFKQQIMQISEDTWVYRNYFLPSKWADPSSLYFRHQIDYLHNIDKLKNKDFLDVGGFIGDSALMFTEYTNGNIYSFEPTSRNYDLTLKTIEMNGCKNIIPVNIALGSKDETLPIKIQGGASTFTKHAPIYNDKSTTELVKVTTLDNYVKGKDLDIGLIKVDIEGFEQEFLKGAEQTIRKYKPTLLISIYHNASDFFDIKPLIESWNLGYTFQISGPINGTYGIDTLLICELN